MGERDKLYKRFRDMGIHVKILRTKEDFEKADCWIIPTNDRKGMIKINTPWRKIFKKYIDKR